jgi:hypothetical protein
MLAIAATIVYGLGKRRARSRGGQYVMRLTRPSKGTKKMGIEIWSMDLDK